MLRLCDYCGCNNQVLESQAKYPTKHVALCEFHEKSFLDAVKTHPEDVIKFLRNTRQGLTDNQALACYGIT